MSRCSRGLFSILRCFRCTLFTQKSVGLTVPLRKRQSGKIQGQSGCPASRQRVEVSPCAPTVLRPSGGGGANNSPEDAGGIQPGVVLMEGVDCVRLMKSDSRAKSETKKPIYADIPPLFKGWFLASAQLPYLNRLFPRMNPKYPVGLLTSC